MKKVTIDIQPHDYYETWECWAPDDMDYDDILDNWMDLNAQQVDACWSSADVEVVDIEDGF